MTNFRSTLCYVLHTLFYFPDTLDEDDLILACM